MVCLALKLIGSWVVVGFSVGMEVLDGLLLLNVPCSEEFSGVLGLGLKPLASCPQVTPGSHHADCLSYSPCPTVCPGMWGVFYISCFHVLRLQPTSFHCWVASP